MTDHQPTTAPALALRDLRVTFDGFTAVDGVDLDVPPGDIRFLIGPNGAGKTTLVDAVTGLAKATGSAVFAGRDLLGLPVHKIARLGIGRTFQTAAVFEELTVEQNLDIAAGAGRPLGTLLRARRTLPPVVEQALETVDLTHQRTRKAGSLSHGQKQWLEIGMLLVQDVRLMLLDEPVAGMGHEEREATGRLLGRLAEDRTVVVIEHDMEFMRAFARSVTVLHAGRVLSEGTVGEVQADPRVQEVYLGRAAAVSSSSDPDEVPAIAAPAAAAAAPAAAATPADESATAPVPEEVRA